MSDEPVPEPDAEVPPDAGDSPGEAGEGISDDALAEAGLADPAFADAALTSVAFAEVAPLPALPLLPGEAAPSDPVPASTLLVSPSLCLRCGADLSRLPEVARYCPRCGLDTRAASAAHLPAGAPVGPPPPAQVLGGWKHLSQWLDAPSHSPRQIGPVTLPTADATSVMIQGYGNAMYRLGQRYEGMWGTGANAREALRCYSKSARLGNVWALARIASHLMAVAESATPAPDGSHPAPNPPQT